MLPQQFQTMPLWVQADGAFQNRFLVGLFVMRNGHATEIEIVCLLVLGGVLVYSPPVPKTGSNPERTCLARFSRSPMKS